MSTPPAREEPSADLSLHGNLTGLVLRNTAAQTLGRAFVTLARYAGFVLIIRAFGAERWGEYALLMAWLTLGENLVDFGLSEVFVRELSRTPERRTALLSSYLVLKLGQGLLAWLLLAGGLWAAGYEATILQAGLLGGAALLLWGLLLVWRAHYRARLTLGRDALADVGGGLVQLALVALVAAQGGGLWALLAAFVAGRATQTALAAGLAGAEARPRLAQAERGIMRQALSAALPIGLTMAVVTLTAHLDTLMLAELLGLKAVGLFAAAWRFAVPATLIAASFAGTLYPILAASWQRDTPRLHRTFQAGMEASFLLASAIFCVFFVGAEGLMALLGAEVAPAAPVLRVLACIVPITALNCVLGPTLFAVGAQRPALLFACTGLALKVLLLVALIPGRGLLGPAWASLGTELLTGFLLPLLCVQRYLGYRLRWGLLLRAALAAGIAVSSAALVGWHGTLAGAGLALLVLGPAALLTGAVNRQRLASLFAAASR
ncbi:MAG: oligosaccharide flippase family protein [Planctomycetota bacterium]